MPITTIGSYIPTATEVNVHWTDVNADLLGGGGTELLLKGGYALASFTADRDTLQLSIDSIESFENARVLAVGDRDANKENMLERLRQFRAAVRIHMEDSSYDRATPTLPNPSTSESKFLRPLVDMEDVWERIDVATDIPDFTPTLTLRGEYTLAGFQTDLQTLRAAFDAVTEAENNQEIARKQRDELLEPLRERMLQYRAMVELQYGEGHPFVASLPDVYPPSGGGSGEQFVLSGSWDAALVFAALEWTPHDDPDLQDYQPWYTQGATFDQNTAISITSQGPGVTQLNTIEGLTFPGDVATYRIYAVLSTGEQIASNDLTITRP
jgi:hypothetical protein